MRMLSFLRAVILPFGSWIVTVDADDMVVVSVMLRIVL